MANLPGRSAGIKVWVFCGGNISLEKEDEISERV
jgi:hypothetical protein